MEWSLNSDRNVLTFKFYNRTDDGHSLTLGQTYNGVLTVTDNSFIEDIPATSFTITVE